MDDHAEVRCWRCGRLLTTPLSTYVGMGPVCRGANGLVAERGWSALQALAWQYRPEQYATLIAELRDMVKWWQARTALLDPQMASGFEAALQIVGRLEAADLRNGVQVVGCVFALVALVRFQLEPALRTLCDAHAVEAVLVEGVRELAGLFPTVESLLCGVGALEDAMDVAEVRRRDRVVLADRRQVEPETGIECGAPFRSGPAPFRVLRVPRRVDPRHAPQHPARF